MTQTFSKYHGLGNDFLLLESTPDPLPQHLIQLLCDRHHGVGADGILLVSPDPTADARMIIFNADGSRPEMCGNGLRCVAFHVAAKTNRHPTSTSLKILTDDGIKTCLVHLDPPSPLAQVQIDMGPVVTPTTRSLLWKNQTLRTTTASVGNPHIVLFEPPVNFQQAAQDLSHHPSFREGANVSFVTRTEENTFHVQVWERGVGPTLACGTAACAVAACAVHENLALPTLPIHIHLPGGMLDVTITPDRHAILTGPARHVFDGHLMPL